MVSSTLRGVRFGHSFSSQLPDVHPRNLQSIRCWPRSVAMAMANGRGDENKIRILSEYGLRPVMHTVLLNGQSLTCCCGLPVTDRFYQFDLVSHFSGRVVNTLYAGEECAERFLLLSQTLGSSRITPLALFDPLQ